MTVNNHKKNSQQINTTRIVTDDNGSVVYSAAHGPYGDIQKTWVNTYDPKLKFSGKERESYSEYDYFGARYYDHFSHRFLSPDPVRNKDEVLTNPQLWNLYSYCNNNPITYFDPDGRLKRKKDGTLKFRPLGISNRTHKDAPGISRLYLDKESPLRLVSGGQFQTHPSFEMLVRSLLRRVHLLSAFYCDGPDYVDFSDLIALSKEVKVVNAGVHWQQQMRFSYRQEKNVSMGGVSGWIEIKGDIEKFIPYLKIGEYLHVGKGTGLGLGKIKIENMRE